MTTSPPVVGPQRSWARPRLLLLYHFLAPDDVVSAQLFTELGEGLAARGWDVEAWPSVRRCHGPPGVVPARARSGRVRMRRVWRPPWPQGRALGRVANAAWMLAVWTARAWTTRRVPHVVLVGTDPLLSVMIAPAWRRRGVRVVHWCFDVFPEAAVADGRLREGGVLHRALVAGMRRAYRAVDVLVDLGACMRARLEAYPSGATRATIPPFALVEPSGPEPADPGVRAMTFGPARLALLYAGSFGHAHQAGLFLDLAHRLGGDDVVLTWGVRGRAADALRARVRPEDHNIRFVPFAAQEDLGPRLAAADVHLVSLQPGWTGTVVPSKFFAALAIGRPVVFLGDPACAVARWIVEHDIGWVLTPGTLDAVAAALRALRDDPAHQGALRARCHAVYQAHFARRHALAAFEVALQPPPSLAP